MQQQKSMRMQITRIGDDPGGNEVYLFNGNTLPLADLDDRAIALDGIVQGPAIDGDKISLDHHQGCLRLVTTATCEQVRTVIALGLDLEKRTIYANDVDPDVVLSLWLLGSPERCNEDEVRELTRAIGTIDAHGPAGSRLLSPREDAMASAFFAKMRGLLPRDVQSVFLEWPSLINQCLAAVDEVLTDAVMGRLEIDDSEPANVAIMFTGDTASGIPCAMARCDDFGGFDHLYNQGFRVVCLVADAADDSRRFTIGKLSDLVEFNLGPLDSPGSLLSRLNEREPGWGGGSSIGGSPRLEGGVSSRLDVDHVWKFILDTPAR